MRMKLLVLLTLVLLHTPGAQARIWYVHPDGGGSDCTETSPCKWSRAVNRASGNDTVWFQNGTYDIDSPGNKGFITKHDGTSNAARLTFAAVNRRRATLRYAGGNNSGQTFQIRHSNITVRGFRIRCVAANGNNSWDCVQTNGTKRDVQINNVLFDDIHAEQSGASLFGCFLSQNVELKNSTFDLSGETNTDGRGEAMYLSSCCSHGNACSNFRSHHNIFARYAEQGADFKDATRNAVIDNSFYIDEREKIGNTGPVGNAVFIGQGPGQGTSAAGNVVKDTIILRPLTPKMWLSDDSQRLDFTNNVAREVSGAYGARQMNHNASTGVPNATSSGNTHCPSEGMSNGPDKDQDGTPNSLNQADSVCINRINAILGVPGVASCEIGNVNNNTVVVNLQADRNGPVSSVGTAGQLAVTYNNVAQTESSVSLPSGTTNQARIVMATAAVPSQTVRLTPAVGAIKNSAFIGGKNCSLPIATVLADPGGTARNPGKVANGNGVCGTNLTAPTIVCVNHTDGTGTDTSTDTGTDTSTDTDTDTSTDTSTDTDIEVSTLDQAVFRFYAEHRSEGASPLAPEQGDVTLAKGKGFRLRIAVRGGGDSSVSRTYVLASRICNPTCGVWRVVVEDHSVTGVTYQDDQVQQQGAPTNNILSIGSRIFLPGSFIEIPDSTSAVVIDETHQIEWEFSLSIPLDGNPLVAGNRVEFRVQRNDGGALDTYSFIPSVTIGSSAGTFNNSPQ